MKHNLTFFSGPMCSGKSSAAYDLIHGDGVYRAYLIRPRISVRAHDKPNHLVTRSGKEYPAITFEAFWQFFSNPSIAFPGDMLWLDDPFLFVDSASLASYIPALLESYPIVISSILATSELKPISSALSKVASIADSLTMLLADCEGCGAVKGASRSLYIGKEVKGCKVLVGAGNEYRPVCIDCWNRLIDFTPAHKRRESMEALRVGS